MLKLEDRLITTYKTGSIIGIIMGSTICLAGLTLILLGLTGSIEWIVKVGTFSSKLVNASPGAFFSVIGLIIIVVYKPRIKYIYNFKKTPWGSSGSGNGKASSPLGRKR